jgi:hypothetical protein
MQTARTWVSAGDTRFSHRLSATDLVRLKNRVYDIINLQEEQVLSSRLRPLRRADRDAEAASRGARCTGYRDCDVSQGRWLPPPVWDQKS